MKKKVVETVRSGDTYLRDELADDGLLCSAKFARLRGILIRRPAHHQDANGKVQEHRDTKMGLKWKMRFQY